MQRFGYANENLLINQFQGIGSIDCDNPNDCPPVKSFENGDDVLNFFKANPEMFNSNMISLVVLIVGWRVMSFIVLLVKSRRQ